MFCFLTHSSVCNPSGRLMGALHLTTGLTGLQSPNIYDELSVNMVGGKQVSSYCAASGGL